MTWWKCNYLDVFLLGVVFALLALDDWGDVGAGMDDGVGLDDDDDDICIRGGISSTSDEEEFIVWGGDEATLITSGLFTASPSSDDWWGAEVKSTKASDNAIVRFAPVIAVFNANSASLKPLLAFLDKKPSLLLLLLLLGGDLVLPPFNISAVAWTIFSFLSKFFEPKCRI